jgi:hypothetical protein
MPPGLIELAGPVGEFFFRNVGQGSGNGNATVDLRCHSAVAEIAVTGDEISISFRRSRKTAPERIDLD